MNRLIWLMVALVFVYGCGSKEGEPQPQKMTNSSNQQSDFVPEHVRRSTIEVVPH